jgi:hypothetical protein
MNEQPLIIAADEVAPFDAQDFAKLTARAAGEKEVATLHNGRLILKGAQLLFEHDPEKPLYPKYATVAKRHNRHERRQLEARLEAAKKRARKANKGGQK